MPYQTFLVDIKEGIAHVRFNRPEKSNAVNKVGWAEMKAIFEEMDQLPEVRVVVLSGEGKNFCSGIDVSMLMDSAVIAAEKDMGRRSEKIRQNVKYLQDCITAIERCRKPVLAAVQRACIGGGIDIITACDMRYASEDAYFSVREVDMGLVADIGTVQRLPRIIPDGIARELIFTGRNVGAAEARQIGLVNQVFEDREKLLEGVMRIAENIASKSPLVIRGCKEVILYSRDHTVADGLDYVATWNAPMLQSEDLMKAVQAAMTKQKPVFRD